jgi:hypothetical protein
MLVMKERRPAFRTIEGWARSVLIEAGVIHECEEHGWAKDRADPHARDRALDMARQDPPPGVSPQAASRWWKCWIQSAIPVPNARPSPARSLAPRQGSAAIRARTHPGTPRLETE